LKKKLIQIISGLLMIAFCLLVFRLADPEGFQQSWQEIQGWNTAESDNLPDADGGFRLHMIDVGIGDALLLECDDKTMLIDAGENDAGDTVLAYLAKYKITHLDIAVGTHAHSDHIGGLDVVLAKISCDELLMSKMAESIIPTTKTYTDLLAVIEEKGMKITAAKAGNSFDFGTAKVEILGPDKVYDEMNNTSVVLMVTYGKTRFLLTGDMETSAEKDLMAAGYNLSADVLKVGHHGSTTSTSSKFLKQVNPTYALISVNADNTYGHPHQETLDKLKKAGVTTYLTRDSGSVVLVSDGQRIQIDTEKE